MSSSPDNKASWVRTYRDCRVGSTGQTRDSGRAMDWLFAELPGSHVWFYLEGNGENQAGARRGFVFTDFRIAMDHVRTHGWTDIWLHLFVPRGTPTRDGRRFLLVQSVFELPGQTGYVYVTECGQVFADNDIRVERYMTTNLKLVFQPC